MPGFSLTLLLLPGASEKAPVSAQKIIELLDDPCDAPGWSWQARAPPVFDQSHSTPSTDTPAAATTSSGGNKLAAVDNSAFAAAIKNACQALIAAEGEITRLDSIAGDGDCGLTLRSGAQGVLELVEKGEIDGSDVVQAVIRIAQACEAKMDGTSGALYS